MTDKVSGLSAEMLRLRQLQQSSAAKPGAAAPRPPQEGESSFAEMLQDRMAAPDVKFSAHAVSRLIDRNISLTKPEIDRLRSAVGKAAEKGSQESLVLMGDMAFVVSIKNRTVITALAGQSIRENVFTNIDSAVVV